MKNKKMGQDMFKIKIVNNEFVNKIYRFICFYFLITVAYSTQSYGVIEYPYDDYTIQYLNILFGPLTGIGSNQSVNALSYLIVKSIPLFTAFAMIYAGILGFIGVARSASEGEFLGQKWSSLTVPLKVGTGLALLVPHPSGYAIIQKILMNIILMGISLANTAWGLVLDNYKAGNSFITNKSVSVDDITVANAMIPAALFVDYLLEEELITDYYLSYTKPNIFLNFNNEADIDPINVFELEKDDEISTILDDLNNLLKSYIADPFVRTAANYLSVTDSSGDLTTPTFATMVNQDIPSLNTWKTSCNQDASYTMTKIDEKKANSVDQYEKNGWMSAAFLYWTLAQTGSSNGSYSPLLTVQPSFYDDINVSLQDLIPNSSIIGVTLSNTSSEIALYQEDDTRGEINLESKAQSSLATVPLSFKSLENPYGDALNGSDPFKNFIVDCQTVFKGIIAFFIAGLCMMIAAVGALVGAPKFISSPVHTFFFAIMCLMILMFTLTFVFVPPSLLGGYYLPLVPAIIFAAGAFSWFFKVVEAIIASPLIAIALMQPTDNDFGKAEVALIMTLVVTLKPALMILGFSIAQPIVIIGLSLFSSVYTSLMTFSGFIFSEKTDFMVQVMMFISMQHVIVYSVVAYSTRAFSIMVQIPDQVFSWIGDRGDDSDAKGFIDEIKGGAEDGIDSIKNVFQIFKGVNQLGMKGLGSLGNDKKE